MLIEKLQLTGAAAYGTQMEIDNSIVNKNILIER